MKYSYFVGFNDTVSGTFTLPMKTKNPKHMYVFYCLKHNICIVEEYKSKMMSLAILFHFLSLNMFRTLIYPSSGACDCVVELPHRSSCSVKKEDLALV